MELNKHILYLFNQPTSTPHTIPKTKTMDPIPTPHPIPNPKQIHIVMFPWLAFGHMIPFLELSKLIAQKGHKVSFISTPRNIDRLPKLPPDISHLITFVKLPLPHIPNLPQNAESTSDLLYDKVKYLKLAYDALQQPLLLFLKSCTSTPDWIFYDFAAYWIPPMAKTLKIPSVFFSIFIAASCGFVGPVSVLMGDDYRNKLQDFTVSPKWVPFKSNVAFKLFEISRIFQQSIAGEEENVSDLFRIRKSIEGCDILAIRSSKELESDWLSLLENIHEKQVIPVGQLPTTWHSSNDDDESWEKNEINFFLDENKKGSVVYVAFGSEAKPSQNEVTEIALGLELSNLPFFWVLKSELELPNGFEERVKGRGVVWKSWVPQMRILSHESVGGFLSHAGWSSVVEAIQFGISLILLTFMADQGLNARVLEEKGIGYSVPRDERDGSFTRDAVAESLKLVMVEEEGKMYRDKVKEVKGMFADRELQEKYVDSLLDKIRSLNLIML